jgi:hypothetical protein
MFLSDTKEMAEVVQAWWMVQFCHQPCGIKKTIHTQYNIKYKHLSNRV